MTETLGRLVPRALRQLLQLGQAPLSRHEVMETGWISGMSQAPANSCQDDQTIQEPKGARKWCPFWISNPHNTFACHQLFAVFTQEEGAMPVPCHEDHALPVQKRARHDGNLGTGDTVNFTSHSDWNWAKSRGGQFQLSDGSFLGEVCADRRYSKRETRHE